MKKFPTLSRKKITKKKLKLLQIKDNKKKNTFKKLPKTPESRKKVFKNVLFLLISLVSTPIFYFIIYFINLSL